MLFREPLERLLRSVDKRRVVTCVRHQRLTLGEDDVTRAHDELERFSAGDSLVADGSAACLYSDVGFGLAFPETLDFKGRLRSATAKCRCTH